MPKSERMFLGPTTVLRTGRPPAFGSLWPLEPRVHGFALHYKHRKCAFMDSPQRFRAKDVITCAWAPATGVRQYLLVVRLAVGMVPEVVEI